VPPWRPRAVAAREEKKNAWPLAPARHHRSGERAYLLLLLPVDFFSPPPALLRLLLLLPLLAWLRSLWVSLLPLLDMLPLPLLPLLFDEEDFELRDAIDISLDRFLRPLRVHWPRVDSRGAG
jgi:hypothetical protein